MEDAEMQPMMEDMMEGSKKGTSKAASSTKSEPQFTEDDMCCCCICQCQDKEVKDLSCCGCFPIKCGVISIGALTIFLTVLIFVETYYSLLNEYLDWWYVVISCVLLIPLFVACSMYVAFFNNDTEGTRTAVFSSCMLVIISFSLICAWNTLYFVGYYKKDHIYLGNSDEGYITLTKRQFFFWNFFLVAIIDSAYMYFICVTGSYSDALKEKKPDEAMMAAMEDMMDKMMSEKMSKMSKSEMGMMEE